MATTEFTDSEVCFFELSIQFNQHEHEGFKKHLRRLVALKTLSLRNIKVHIQMSWQA